MWLFIAKIKAFYNRAYYIQRYNTYDNYKMNEKK